MGSADAILYHLVPGAELAERCDDTHYRAPSLAEEGFIHLSTADQVAGVASGRYTEVEDLILLHIVAAELDAVRWEDLYGHGDFPHQYGPIPLSAIIEQTSYERP